ncbi:spore protein YkuD-like protein [Centipeda periodontii DSM 2778]|uniref:Spore protein YkuD-like protein n=1 Tax=Centipeda periodontii DSM 2778 TaxID=888060 RepID=F5RK29_9FIRM|nr:L,D-transpeptidase [Centipeda periodontii]EGK61211.1 spore protein YkuD-like protein [Centipeda periodontii DSM 2778]
MRPLLLIGITVLLLCTAGCTSHIGKRINDCNTSETTVPQQNATQEAKTEQAVPLIANAPSGTSILIRKSEFRLYLLVNGNVVQSWPIALGKNAGQKEVVGDMKTPNGSFPVDEVLGSSDWTHDFGDGKGEIAGAYGPYFISLDTSALSGGAWDGIGIHGTHDPASIGTRASEGCIRMNNEDLCALKEHVNVGMQVTIEE